MSRNAHLVPPAVHDIIMQLDSPTVGENERMALIQRLEATRDHCIRALNRHLKAQVYQVPVKPTKKTRG